MCQATCCMAGTVCMCLPRHSALQMQWLEINVGINGAHTYRYKFCVPFTTTQAPALIS